MKQNKIAKLIHISDIQKEKLDEIAEEVFKQGGEVNTTQLIRDSIQILIENYQNEIIKRYIPVSLKSLIK